jgi:hypothetical protein
MKRLSLLFLLAFATQAFAQFYVPPYQTWRQTLLTNLTMAGTRADLGIINATNVVVDPTVFTTTGDTLGLISGAPITNAMAYGTGNLVRTNQAAVVALTNVANTFKGTLTGTLLGNAQTASNVVAGVILTNPVMSGAINGTAQLLLTNSYNNIYGGAGLQQAATLTLHRDSPTNTGGLFFKNDYTYGVISNNYIQLGFDSIFAGGPYWAIYLDSLGTDVMRIGATNGIQGHFVFGSKAVPTTDEMVCINDYAFQSGTAGLLPNDYLKIQYSLALNCASNGLITRAWGNPYDGVTITKNFSTDPGWLTFMNDMGNTNRWRVGALSNDFVIYEGAAATHTAPGNEVFKIKRDEQYHIKLKNNIEVGTAPVDMTQPTQVAPTLVWGNALPGTTEGWLGMVFTNGVDDMAIHKIGRYTAYGFTNASHTIMLLTLQGSVITTNVTAKLPKSFSRKNSWVWADCYYVVPASAVCWILSDFKDAGDFWTQYDTALWPWYRGIDTNIVGATQYTYTNGVLNPTFYMPYSLGEGNLGPTAYLRY